MTVQMLADLVQEIVPNTTLYTWIGDRPGAYCVLVPHTASSLRSDDTSVEDKTTMCSLHYFTSDLEDQTIDALFDVLVSAGVACDDPISDYSEADEIGHGGWIHHIIDCFVKR